MNNLYIYTLFDPKSSYPIYTGIKDDDKIVIVELYKKGSKTTIDQIHKNCDIIKQIILRASCSGRSVVLSDFKSYLKQFDLPLMLERYNVYDLHLPDVGAESLHNDRKLIVKILEKMAQRNIYEYQRIIANAAVVYQDLENSGLLLNYSKIKPIWSQKTFSGRSKTVGFNIQGHFEDDWIRPVGSNDVVLIHFDWICADIRVASILAGDDELSKSFVASDPYLAMMAKLNAGAVGEPLTRAECKTYLLKSINSMDVSGDALFSVYPALGNWITSCKKTIRSDQSLETILNRKFKRSRSKNDLAVLNGVMQGSVAHAMQLVIRRVWEQIPRCLVAEIHDSLVVCADSDPASVHRTINTVVDIMAFPFRGVLSSSPMFPLKVSVGKRWKKWRTAFLYRESGIQRVPR